MDIFEFTANRIKEVAKSKGISIKQLLNNCELSINTISEMSKGKQISYISLAKMANYLDCSIDYLLGRTDIINVIKDLPPKIIDIITEQYNKNPKEFISDEFIKAPTKAMKKQEYSFYDYYYNSYVGIFDEAYEYANKNGINMLEITGIGSKKEYLEMIDAHDDFIPKMITGKYYSLTLENYNVFLEVYKLYCKAYAEYVKNLLWKW